MFAWPLVVASFRSASNGCGHGDVPGKGLCRATRKHGSSTVVKMRFNVSASLLKSRGLNFARTARSARNSRAVSIPGSDYVTDGTISSIPVLVASETVRGSYRLPSPKFRDFVDM